MHDRYAMTATATARGGRYPPAVVADGELDASNAVRVGDDVSMHFYGAQRRGHGTRNDPGAVKLSEREA